MALKEEFEASGNWLFKHRSHLPLLILGVGAAMIIRTEVYPETFILQETPFEIYYETFCLLVSVFGLAIRIFTVGYTPRNTSGRNVNGQVAESLNTTGIYSLVRHPLYLGNFFMWLGIALLTGNLWFIIAFMLFYVIYYERIMYAEEQFLSRKFGIDYETWANHTPAIIPSFRKFKPAGIKFNWKKVLKKEKNGLFAVFLIFALFDVIGELIERHKDFNYFLLGMLLFTALLYGIVKLVRKYTSLLQEDIIPLKQA
jgi:protein-S-isoprenylcysteine O-methyltransferase Ste14